MGLQKFSKFVFRRELESLLELRASSDVGDAEQRFSSCICTDMEAVAVEVEHFVFASGAIGGKPFCSTWKILQRLHLISFDVHMLDSGQVLATCIVKKYCTFRFH